MTSAWVVTSCNSSTKPVGTAIGAGLGGDYKTLRAEMANLAGMFSSVGDALKKANADWHTWLPQDGAKGYEFSQSQELFNATKAYYDANGTAGERIYMGMVDLLHSANSFSLFNYGPRMMAWQDSVAGVMSARGRAREKAFVEVDDESIKAGNKIHDNIRRKGVMGDDEKNIKKDMWNAYGQLSDEKAKSE